ncbi:MAG TPA: hypothetical protein VG329_02435 [Candidatus Dormibacteraeota bacterium]|nr:hypothetical protein [Candidatus Dormibacteraeota bacterium]
MGAVLVLGIAGIYALQSQAKPTVSPNALPSLQDALRTVPSHDTPGEDVPGLPRPDGSVRTYYLVNGTVTTLIYTERTPVSDVRAELAQRLPVAGWVPAVDSSPLASGADSSLVHATYFNGQRVVQVQVFRSGSVTSTTFVLQEPPQH